MRGSRLVSGICSSDLLFYPNPFARSPERLSVIANWKWFNIHKTKTEIYCWKQLHNCNHLFSRWPQVNWSCKATGSLRLEFWKPPHLFGLFTWFERFQEFLYQSSFCVGKESGCKTTRSDWTKVHGRSPEIDQKEHVTISGKQRQLLKTWALTLLHRRFYQNWMKIDDLVSDIPSS